MPEIPQEVVDQIDRALTGTVTTALTISPLLNDAYPDDPRWTPYTRWVEPNAERAMMARDALRAACEGVSAVRLRKTLAAAVGVTPEQLDAVSRTMQEASEVLDGEGYQVLASRLHDQHRLLADRDALTRANRGDDVKIDRDDPGLGHLADDAQYVVCSECGRKSWGGDQAGAPCGMPQPNGTKCAGVFGLPVDPRV